MRLSWPDGTIENSLMLIKSWSSLSVKETWNSNGLLFVATLTVLGKLAINETICLFVYLFNLIITIKFSKIYINE